MSSADGTDDGSPAAKIFSSVPLTRASLIGVPADVMRWYYSDNNRLAEVEAIVIENNVTNFVLAQAKVSDKTLSFDELMAQN